MAQSFFSLPAAKETLLAPLTALRHALHSDRFYPSDELLPLGAAVFAEMALGLLNEEENA